MDVVNILKENFSKVKKVTSTSLSKFFKTNQECKEYLNSILERTPEWESIGNLVTGLIKDIQLPKCKICGKTLRYSRLLASYCSKECKNADKDLFDRIKQTNIKKYGVDNPAKAKEIQEKTKKTNIERYGVENATQSKTVQAKIKETNKERYGVENVFQSKEIQKKIQQTFDEKYNGNPNRCKDVRDKIKETCLERYGALSPFQNKEVIDKAVATRLKNGSTRNQLLSDRNWNSEYAKQQREKVMIDKYGVAYPFQVKEIKEKAMKTNIQKYGGPAPVFDEEVKQKMMRSRHDLTYERDLIRFKGIVEPMFTKEEFQGAENHTKKYLWKCCKCGNVFEDHCYSHIPRCMKCKPYATNYSFMELDLLEFIKSFYPTAHKDKKLIGPKELDCVIDELHLAIEFNGKFWHSVERGKGGGYHLNKVKLCNEKGYRLIHIWEDEWIDDPERIKEKLRKVLEQREDLSFGYATEVTLDRSWYNNIDIPGYELVAETHPTVVKRHMYDTENCGCLVYRRLR